MDLATVSALFSDLTQVELTTWVERGWVIPDDAGPRLEFREIDIARVRLIHDLRHRMEVAEDTMPLVLLLLDQVYELRSRLKSVLHALGTQPREVQHAILATMQREVG
jgi:chaperone modulatory protein CbpM